MKVFIVVDGSDYMCCIVEYVLVYFWICVGNVFIVFVVVLVVFYCVVVMVGLVFIYVYYEDDVYCIL